MLKITGGEVPQKFNQEVLKEFSDQKIQVSVFASQSEVRTNFDAGISVVGELEQHPEIESKFRIYVNEGTYAYFDVSNVVKIATTIFDKEIPTHQFKDGSFAVIQINI